MIAGNWKMNLSVEESLELVKSLHYQLKYPGEVDIVVAPPVTSLAKVADILKDTAIGVSAQNIYWQDKGAFTGEVSAPMVKEAGADYVKTSTGFSGGGATVEDITLMRRVVGPEMGVKASGGVGDYDDARNMVDAGATRIGASAGVKILAGEKEIASMKIEPAFQALLQLTMGFLVVKFLRTLNTTFSILTLKNT